MSSITLTDGGTLELTAAQALGDTHALSAITNASYAIAVVDSAANISANFDALNEDPNIASIALAAGGSQTLTLTLSLAQATNDTRALGEILYPYAITIADSAADLAALTTAAIANLSDLGVTMLQAVDKDVALTTAQKQALGAAGIAFEQPFSGGSVEVTAYRASGAVKSVEYLGIVSAAYTSYTVGYGANGKPLSASYSNGMMAAWTYEADSSYEIAYVGVTGEPYTSYTAVYAANGQLESASYGNGMTAVWTYNADGSYQIAYAGVTGEPYTSYTLAYGANGRPQSASYSNGMTAAWTYNPDGSYDIAYSGVTGAPYTSDTAVYAVNGELESASYGNGMTAVWTYNADGSYQIAYAGVTGEAYTSYTMAYRANGRPQSASYSNGMTAAWAYNPGGSYDIAYSGVTGAPYASYTIEYGADGNPESATYSNGMSAAWTYNSDGSHEVVYQNVGGLASASPGQASAFYSEDFSGGTLGSNTVPGWTVTGSVNSVAVVDSAIYVANAGGINDTGSGNFLSFGTANSPDDGVATSPAISVTAGQTYALTFDYGSFGSPSSVQSLEVEVNGVPLTTVTTSGSTNDLATVLSPYSFSFVAPTSSITLSFLDKSAVTNDVDGLLDNVAVSTTNASSYTTAYDKSGTEFAKAADMPDGSGDLTLSASGVTVWSAANALSATREGDPFEFTTHSNESIVANGVNSETFAYGAGFGQSAISAFQASGGSNDVIQFSASMFDGLSNSNSAAQNWADLLSSGAAAQSGPNVTITDSSRDVLTLKDVTAAMLSASANSAFNFV